MPNDTPKTNKKKVLVAEDERPIANVLLLKLKHSGFEAEAAYNGNEALEMMEKNKYDILLLDLVMPLLDGFAVLEKLREQKNKIPVIVLSNLGQEEDIERAKELGANDYFVKSDIAITDVVNNIKNILKIKK